MNIAFLGTGLLGFPMAEKLIDEGHEVVVYNRTIQKALPLKDLGAEIAENVEHAVRNSNIIILMLTDYVAIKEVLLRSKICALLNGKCVIQMGTISPVQSKELQKKLEPLDCEYFEAPVLGSINEVKNRNLIIMVGSTQKQFEKYKTLFRTFGSKILHIGEVGQAAGLKLALNQLIASLTAAFSISLSYIQKNGIDVELFMDILRASALYAPTFDKKLPKMLTQDFKQANFPVQHLLKDLELMINDSKRLNVETGTLESLSAIIRNTLDRGYKDQDYSSIFMGIYDRRKNG